MTCSADQMQASEPRPLRNEEYTIGWIAALPHEAIAAKATLDDFHGRQPRTRNPSDQNSYILGQIRDHNIVIASLPGGVIGPTAANTTAMHMLASFPSIRISLMVGIGAGIPKIRKDRKTSQYRDIRDMRLGDVVISQPGGSHGGVKQYDFGKATVGGNFQFSGHVNSPPRPLLNAVGVLRQFHEGGESKMPGILSQILKNLKNAMPSYEYPGPELDRLFEVTYPHPQDEETCDDCDESREIRRPDRPTNDPRVHCGVIASGNQVIKDPVVRDRLESDCICFEMEAAGLMNDFPCLVIRGICDYADSHKNDCWQRYAAATAAACAKEVLSIIPAVEVENELLARDISQAVIEAVKGILDESLTKISKNVSIVSQVQIDKDHQTILEWLTPVDYTSQQNDFIRRQQPGTGQWFLDSEKFEGWISRDKQTLYCPGIPGAGKTIIAAMVINYLQSRFRDNKAVGIAYIYCNFQRQHEQNPEDLLACLLKQLGQTQSSLPTSVKVLYNQHIKTRTRPSFADISTSLHSVAATYSRVFIVIDALDEYHISNNSRTRFLKEIFGLQCHAAVNILSTSRHVGEISNLFAKSAVLPISAQHGDLEAYLAARMSDWDVEILDDDIRAKIKTGVPAAADGMFLLAKLHMDTLQSQITKGDIRRSLQKLGKGEKELDKTYEQALERINSQATPSRQLAWQVLGWIVHSKRPLSTLELRHALAIRQSTTRLDEDFLPSDRLLQSVCAGLVTVDKENNMIRLDHYTIQEFFGNRKETLFPNTMRCITEDCVRYLSFSMFENGCCRTEEEFETRLRSNPFYDYAARNWGRHVLDIECEDDRAYVKASVVSFLKSATKVEASSQVILASRLYSTNARHQWDSQRIPKELKGLHLAAYFGLSQVMEHLLVDGHDPNSKDTYDRTPLWYAAQNGHECAVNVLLGQTCLEPDCKDNYGRTPLSWAAEKGHEGVVKQLLASGRVNPNLRDPIHHRSPLWKAVEKGHENVVKLLLEKNADLDCKDKYGQTTLMIAIRKHCHSMLQELLKKASGASLWTALKMRDDYVVELLLKRGVNLECKQEKGLTPLLWAIKEGQGTIVKLLLENGADCKAKDEYDQTSLLWATKKADVAVVRLLLERAADSECRDKFGWTPLLWAAKEGYEMIVYLLLKNGTSCACRDSHNRTPLLWAIKEGQGTIVKLLLENGADYEAKDEYDQTSLLWATKKADVAVVRLLLERAADSECKDKFGWTPLLWAAKEGYETIVHLLLKNGTSCACRDSHNRTPLLWAMEKGNGSIVKLLFEKDANLGSKEKQDFASRSWAAPGTQLMQAAQTGQEAVVKLLIDNGANIEFKDTRYGGTPLLWAAERGHKGVVRVLLEKGADVESRDGEYGKTALLCAADKGHKEVVQMLLRSGSDYECTDEIYGRTPLISAAEKGNAEIMKLLLEAGADMECRDTTYCATPLSWAAEKGHEEIVNLLIEMGADVECRDGKHGQTPLFWAAKEGHKKVVMLLIKEGANDESLKLFPDIGHSD